MASRAVFQRVKALLKSKQPDVVRQGIALVASMGDGALYARLLEGVQLEQIGVSRGTVRFQMVMPGPALSGPKKALAQRAAVVLALAADAPPEVAVARHLRDHLEWLQLGDLSTASEVSGLWGLAAYPRLRGLLVCAHYIATADRAPRHLELLCLSRGTGVEALVQGGLTSIDGLSLESGSLRLDALAGVSVRSLDLSKGMDLRPLSGIPGLESLSLDLSFQITLDLPPLPGLHTLKIRGHSDLRDLTALDQTPGLRVLHLSDSRHLTNIDGAGLPPDLEALHLSDMELLVGVSGLSSRSLRALTLWRLPVLSSVPPLPPTLQSVRVHHLPKLSALSLSALPVLETLVVGFCPLLTALPALHPAAPLREVEVYYNEQMTHLASLPAMAPGAKVSIHHLPRLTEFLGVAGVRHPTTVVAHDLAWLEAIDLSAEETGLRELTLWNCPALSGLTASRSLEMLWLSSTKVERLEGIAGCTALHRLGLLDAPRSPAQAQPIHGLPGLRTLLLGEREPGDLSALLASLPMLEWLSLSGVARTHLDDAASLQALRVLRVSATEALQDIAGLSGLPALETVSLRWAQNIADLSPLATLPSLQMLELSAFGYDAGRADLAGLEGCPRLETLRIPHAYPLRDLSALAAISSLRSLRLETCRGVRDLSPLAQCGGLETLELGEVADLSGLAGAAQVRRLALCSARVADLSVLASLPALEAVSLSHCASISAASWALLGTLPGLRQIFLGHETRKTLPRGWTPPPGAALAQVSLYPDWTPELPRL